MNPQTIKCERCNTRIIPGNYPGPYRLTCPSCGTILSSKTGKRWDAEKLLIFDHHQGRISEQRRGNRIVFWVFGVPFGLIIVIALIMAIGQSTRKVESILSSDDNKIAEQAQTPNLQTPSAGNALPVSTKQDTINLIPASNAEALNSLIDSASIKYTENFQPIALINLHNNKNKMITQVEFRFEFTSDREPDGSMGYVEGTEECSYATVSVNLRPTDYTTQSVPIPSPQRKVIDSPHISIYKVRFADGSLQKLNK